MSLKERKIYGGINARIPDRQEVQGYGRCSDSKHSSQRQRSPTYLTYGEKV